ncbi:MAG TPA: hypothetical protein VK963_00665 [Candidatus Saccharimonadales bacterium]|nr:hypothetical protein [Candidatus Saccharimonadales bacterium]
MASAKKQSDLSTNNFIMIMVAVSLVAVVLSVIVGRVLVSQILLNNKVISKKVQADNQLKRNIAAVQQLSLEYQQLGSRRGLILNSLPIKADVPGLTSALELIAGTSGLKLKSITPATATAAATPAPAEAAATPATDTASSATPAADAVAGPTVAPVPYQVSVNVEGNYVSLVKFLRNLELSARPLRVTAVKVGGTSATMTAELELTSYWQAEADLVPKTETVQ